MRLFYEVYGTGEPTVFLLPDLVDHPFAALEDARSPTWPGTAGWSPSTGAATAARTARRTRICREAEFAADALAVMDATGTARATIVSLSCGAQRALILAAEHPDRVAGAVFICPAVPLEPPLEDGSRYPWDEVLATDEGWAK